MILFIKPFWMDVVFSGCWKNPSCGEYSLIDYNHKHQCDDGLFPLYLLIQLICCGWFRLGFPLLNYSNLLSELKLFSILEYVINVAITIFIQSL